MSTTKNILLLSPTDPDPVERVNWESDSEILLVCEHAGQAIPSKLGDLGVDQDAVNSHRGWDINAEKLALEIAGTINAPLVIQRYSRLVIDCNRPPESPESTPLSSDGVCITGNADISTTDKNARIEEIFKPFDAAIVEGLGLSKRTCVFSIHSFTPVFGGERRLWQAGFITRNSTATAQYLMDSVVELKPELIVELNQPYQISDETDWLIPVYAEPRGLAHCLIEVRNDQISTRNDIAFWANALSAGMLEIAQGVSCP